MDTHTREASAAIPVVMYRLTVYTGTRAFFLDSKSGEESRCSTTITSSFQKQAANSKG